MNAITGFIKSRPFFNLSEQECDIIATFYKEVIQSTDLRQMSRYIQHGSTDGLLHSLAVAHFSYLFAKRLHISVDRRSLIIGALLHDYFLYDWHEPDKAHKWHGFRHPFTAFRNARRDFVINKIEGDIILRHMFPLIPIPPIYKESAIVCFVDKICSLYETFSKDPYRNLRVGMLLDEL